MQGGVAFADSASFLGGDEVGEESVVRALTGLVVDMGFALIEEIDGETVRFGAVSFEDAEQA